MTKRYKLLKDLPGLLAGVIYVNHSEWANRWYPESAFDNGELIHDKASLYGLTTADVDDTEFFEPIEENKVSKPPIGIKPEWLWKEERLSEVTAAIRRYYDDGKEPLPEWKKEQEYLCKWLNEREEKKNRLEVIVWHQLDRNQYGNCYHFATPLDYIIPHTQFALIKEAIEKIINQ